jgi:hypothetical protein
VASWTGVETRHAGPSRSRRSGSSGPLSASSTPLARRTRPRPDLGTGGRPPVGLVAGGRGGPRCPRTRHPSGHR